jgi:hypothetical protein
MTDTPLIVFIVNAFAIPSFLLPSSARSAMLSDNGPSVAPFSQAVCSAELFARSQRGDTPEELL